MESIHLRKIRLKIEEIYAFVLKWLHAYRLYLAGLFVGLCLVTMGGGVYWYRESILGFMGSTISPHLRFPAPPPTVAPDVTIAEQIAELHQKVSNLETEYQQDAQYRQQLTVDFQSAIHEVAQNNDQLVKQGKTLSDAVTAIRAEVNGLSLGAGTLAESPSPSPSSPSNASATTRVNINTATAGQLDTLPGIGPSYADKIIQYRTQHGPFKTVHDITNVTGIGESIFQKIQDLVDV